MNSAATSTRVAPARATLSAAFCLLFIVATWALVYGPGLFSPPLLDDADSVHAEAAREMALTGDWVTLHANGVRYLEKSPLMYWTIAASFRVFGASEWAARLPLALGALALLLATFSLGSRVYGRAGGLFAALVLATSFGPYIFTRFLIPDLLVGLWLTISFDFFLRTLDEDPPSRASCWAIAIASALNVLTKGLIGLVFPAAAIGAYLLLTRTPRHLLRLRPGSSALVFLAVAAPWHLLAGLRNPAQGEVRGFFWFYFVNEHFLRYLNRRVPRDYDTVPLLLFWGLMVLWLLPWSVFLPPAIRDAWRSRPRLASNPTERANLCFALWALVVLVFFSFSTRQEYYAVPALPALALLIGGWLGKEADAGDVASYVSTTFAPAGDVASYVSTTSAPAGDVASYVSTAGRISSAVLMAFGIGAAAASVVLAAGARVPPPGYDIAELLSRNPDKYALSFGHFFDLTGPALGAFRAPLLGFGLSLGAGGVLNLLLRRRGRLVAANLALAACMVAMLGFVHQGFVIFSPALTSKHLAAAIERVYRPGEFIVIDGDYEEGSTLNFYTGHPVRVLNHREANLWYGSLWPDAPHVFETNESLLELWRGPARVYLWSTAREPELLRGMPVHELARGGGKYILSNRE